MSNPISKWIKDIMEKNEDIESKFEERVAENSINSVKHRDLSRLNVRDKGFYLTDPRSRGPDHFFVAHSTLKANKAGLNSSYHAMEFYNDQGRKKRDYMLAKFSSEN
mmetsp:Transcript_379/g.487  ORF Transcript_379/g.487 Transcript_379/m.487 type:complete len:107 (-) Transcript_379:99-419(-)|eukprot:CAMPEP_0178934118 /NCGR_PEP_ID=MMETSP0786-20121207/23691_1 /TAXON_ID=186022 /ORGANISM="Thalassionema frauenfeldii, Strain CCMP 1798" /LENGTH=106 /DNA_ID=CAMNT_0020611877 /DNA_START=20 /DNA_END=340 /DNA_ORIENTATION=-